MTEIVPTSNGITPNFASAKSGAHSVPKKKSTGETVPKNSSAGTISAITIATVVRIETRAQAARTTRMTPSPLRLRAARSRTFGVGADCTATG